MIVIAETRIVYRAPGARQARLTKLAAYRDPAALALRKRYARWWKRRDAKRGAL